MTAQKIYPAERAKELQLRTVGCPRCGAEAPRACRERDQHGVLYSIPMSHTGRLNAWKAGQ